MEDSTDHLLMYGEICVAAAIPLAVGPLPAKLPIMFDEIFQAERQDYDKPGRPGQPFDKQLLVDRRIDGVELSGTLYRPLNWRSQPAPAVVYVHGGGWSAGDRGQFAR
ncbi:MAG: hypothetical protein PHU85_08150, partial [Phycisphaerae bacterium]|nr:hypothetical protein [Phycisphaerae bacterium]